MNGPSFRQSELRSNVLNVLSPAFPAVGQAPFDRFSDIEFLHKIVPRRIGLYLLDKLFDFIFIHIICNPLFSFFHEIIVKKQKKSKDRFTNNLITRLFVNLPDIKQSVLLFFLISFSKIRFNFTKICIFRWFQNFYIIYFDIIKSKREISCQINQDI